MAKKESGTPDSAGGNTGGGAPTPSTCAVKGCKTKPKQFNFCPEHFEHFKFGLVKRNGEKVSDYDRKLEHYQNYLEKQKSAQKAA